MFFLTKKKKILKIYFVLYFRSVLETHLNYLVWFSYRKQVHLKDVVCSVSFVDPLINPPSVYQTKASLPNQKKKKIR